MLRVRLSDSQLPLGLRKLPEGRGQEFSCKGLRDQA